MTTTDLDAIPLHRLPYLGTDGLADDEGAVGTYYRHPDGGILVERWGHRYHYPANEIAADLRATVRYHRSEAERMAAGGYTRDLRRLEVLARLADTIEEEG